MNNSSRFLEDKTWHKPKKEYLSKNMKVQTIHTLQILKHVVKFYHKEEQHFDCIVTKYFLELHRQANPTMPN